jgi:hypothetical protein
MLLQTESIAGADAEGAPLVEALADAAGCAGLLAGLGPPHAKTKHAIAPKAKGIEREFIAHENKCAAREHPQKKNQRRSYLF